MATVAELIVRARADTRDLERGFANMVRQSEALAAGMSQAGRAMLPLTAAIGGLAVGVFGATAKMDSLRKGLEAVAGGSARAQQQLDRLTQIAKLPGIGFEEAIRGSVRLQAIGFNAALAERSLKAFSNAIALTGGNRDNLERVTVQLGQLASKGKVMANDLRPIIENAPAVGRALREAFGTVDTEQIQKLNLTTEQFLDRLLSQLEKLPQVTGGLGNAFDNVKDAIFRTFAALGEDRAAGLTRALNRLAGQVEAVGKAFTSLSPTTQKLILGFGAVAFSIGPLLLVMSSLIRAYQTLIALSLVTSVGAATRAFLAQAVAVRSVSEAMAVLGVASRGVAAALMGPGGIALALTAIIGLAIRAKVQAAEALQKMVQSIGGMNQAMAQGTLTTSVARVAELNTQIDALRKKTSGPINVLLNPYFLRDLGQLNQLTAERTGELEKQRAAAERLNALQELAIPETPLDLGGGTGPAGDGGDRFKDLKKYVSALAEAVQLRLDDSQFMREASALESSLAARAAQVNQTLEDRVTLLSLSNTLADALRGRMEDRTPDLTIAKPGGVGEDIARGMEIVQGRTKGARKEMILLAAASERVKKNLATLSGLSGLGRVLSGIAAQFGRVGERLADMLDNATNVVDALKGLRESQSQTGEKGIFANLGNLTSTLGLVSAGIGLIGGMLGGGQREADIERRHRENVDALQALRDQLSTLSGANLVAQSQQGVSRLLQSRAEINAAGLFGADAQRDVVNRILRDMGISFADLNRLAKELGINLLTSSGRIAADALDEFAEAIGYNVELITKLNDSLETFRSTQDAYNKIFNLQDTPALALQNSLAELEKFAPEIFRQLTQGIDASTSTGQEALRTSLKLLFTRLTSTGTTLSELGDFADIRALMESLLGVDSALDKFRETTDRATASMLNVPQGFKVALRAFQATTPERNPFLPPPTPPDAGGMPMPFAPSTTFAAGAMPITIVTTGDAKKAYADFYAEFERKSLQHPPMRPFFYSLARPD